MWRCVPFLSAFLHIPLSFFLSLMLFNVYGQLVLVSLRLETPIPTWAVSGLGWMCFSTWTSSFRSSFVTPTRRCNTNLLVCVDIYLLDGNLKAATVCPRSLDPIYIVTYFTKWVKTSWTGSIFFNRNNRYLNCSNKLSKTWIKKKML